MENVFPTIKPTTLAIMKSVSALLLLVASSNANVIRPRSPQESHAPKAKGKGLGPFGLDLSFLQGFDGARLGTFLATLQPYFRPAAKSGSIPKFLNRYVPPLALANRVVLQPQVRASAKRTKSRLGPLILAGKGVWIIHALLKTNDSQYVAKKTFAFGQRKLYLP
jgi:hypothetical protein